MKDPKSNPRSPYVIKKYPIGEVPEQVELDLKILVPEPRKAKPREKPKYPTVLSMEEYSTEWKPKGWNIIFIGPTSTWRQEWGMWEAIRDIVQNALDETEAYRWGYDEEGLWISDQGTGVAVADFLLGPPKLKPDFARGKFGEGMKIASLALVRDGHPVHITTVGRELFIIFIQQEVDGRVESLAALWRPDGTRRGTKFHILNYSGTAYSDRFTVNLPKEAILFKAPAKITEPKQRYNQLIQTEFEDGKPRIFARDIYMRSLSSFFSYNLWSFEMAPDRFGPRVESQMWLDMGRLWACVNEVKLLEVFLRMVKDPPIIETEESRMVDMGWEMGAFPLKQMNYMDIMVQNSNVWQAAWVNNFGENAVIRTSDRWDGVVKHLGYQPISVQFNVRGALARVIKTDEGLIDESQERLREVKVIPDAQISPRQLASLKLARAIIADLYKVRRVKGVHAAIIPPASDRVRTAGMYGTTTQEIFISIDQLLSGRDTVDTVIHELAHHSSGVEDGEEAHNKEMPRLAGKLVEAVAKGQYDEEIQDPNLVW